MSYPARREIGARRPCQRQMRVTCCVETAPTKRRATAQQRKRPLGSREHHGPVLGEFLNWTVFKPTMIICDTGRAETSVVRSARRGFEVVVYCMPVLRQPERIVYSIPIHSNFLLRYWLVHIQNQLLSLFNPAVISITNKACIIFFSLVAVNKGSPGQRKKLGFFSHFSIPTPQRIFLIFFYLSRIYLQHPTL